MPSSSPSSPRGSHPRARHNPGTQHAHCIVNIQNVHTDACINSREWFHHAVVCLVLCSLHGEPYICISTGTRSRHPSGSRSRSPRSCSLHTITYKCVDLHTIICKEHDFDRNAISEPTHVPNGVDANSVETSRTTSSPIPGTVGLSQNALINVS